MNEIVKTKNNFIPITEIMSIGKAFVESGMFPDVKTAAQAIVKIQAGQELGIAPFSSMTGIHIIQGRPTVGAGIIAAKIKGSEKYDYKVVKHDETICSVDIYEAKKVIGNSSFTIDDAKRAQTKNLDKYPKNMLFARAISNAVKWFCPDVFSGPVYTPEEMESVEDVPHEEQNTAEYLKTFKPELKPENGKWKDAVEALASGKVNINMIENKYYLSAKNRELLLTTSI